jgi:hypothetical protein
VVGLAGGLSIFVVAIAERGQGIASSVVGNVGGDMLPFLGVSAAGGTALGVLGGAAVGWHVADDIAE